MKAVRSLLLACLVVASGVSFAGELRIANQPVRIADEGAIGDRWMVAEDAQFQSAPYPAEFADRPNNVCVALGYRIKADGTTSQFRVLEQWNEASGKREPLPGFNDAFARAAISAVAHWKFAPRPDVRRPEAVDTVTTMAFRARSDMPVETVRGQCAINDLTAYLDDLRDRDDLISAEVARFERDEDYRQRRATTETPIARRYRLGNDPPKGVQPSQPVKTNQQQLISAR